MKSLVVMLVGAVLLPAALVAHPGHGEVSTLSGTVTAIETERIQLNVFDRSSFTNRLVWVFVDAKTKIQSGKTRLQLADLKARLEVDCMAETEEGKDGTTALRAVQIRLKKGK